MSDLASILPALVGAVLGTVALVSAHVSLKRLRAKRIAADAEEEANAPSLPLVMNVPTQAVWNGTFLPAKALKHERVS